MFMDLYIIRHALAADRDDPRWPDDESRPLTEDGAKRFARMVELLADRGMEPGVIAASPLVRCVETARILSAGTGNPKVVELDSLRPGGEVEPLLQWTARQSRDFESIAWVGHAPDVDRLTAALIGDQKAWIRFAKGAVAAVRFDSPPALGTGELHWLVTAKVLGV
jgi:phosphohistidine phosphatase